MTPQINTTLDYTNPSSFQENPEIVINGNGASLVPVSDLLPDMLSGALFNASLDLNWGGGTLTGTPNGAVITNGKLDLTGNNKSIDLSAVGNANSQQKGAIKLQFTPNYSGNPSAIVSLFSIFASAGSAINDIMLYHNVDGYFHIYIGDQGGNQLFDTPMGYWVPANGTTYEIELDFDLTDGATALFIDGVQLGSTIATTGIRSGVIGILRLGGNFNGTAFCNGYISNLIIFNDVQHTANYTPGYTVPSQAESYPEDSPALIPAGTALELPTTGIVSLSTNSQIPNGSDIRFVIKRADGNNYYWDGTAWAESSGGSEWTSVVDQTVKFNLLNLTDGEIITVIVFLVSNGLVTPSISTIWITAEQYLPNTDNITPCTVFGYLTDPSGNPISGINVSASLPTNQEYGNETMIVQNPVSTVSNAAGYWELNLMPVNSAYTFSFTNGNNAPFTKDLKVPASQAAAFNTLTA